MGFDADIMLREALDKHNIHLSVLVAETGLWANPEVHRILVAETGRASYFPKHRRYRPGQGERCGAVLRNGVRLDNNSLANHAIKQALGVGKSAKGFETCHIWPNSCYDVRYHTAIANLVLLPRALASLSDYNAEVRQVLQYHALELYGWYPEKQAKPSKPNFYPTNWREPEPFTERIAKTIRRRIAAISSWGY